MIFERLSPGAKPSAGEWNALVEEVLRLGKRTAEPPLEYSGDTYRHANPIIFAIIKARDSDSYTWQEVVPNVGGTWQEQGRAGTDAVEVNGRTDIEIGTVVIIRERETFRQ